MTEKKVKTIAMYLPQFHRVKENDEWWGEGYTEWTAVKSARPLFEGHYQPHIPLNNNYYDLMDKKTMEWQADLMHQYDVDGIAIYHYYFKNGKKILEKPVENLLKWKDINMPFCLYWANETWARSWSEISKKAVWNNLCEPGKDKTTDGNNNTELGILLLQDYGREKEWIDHIRYLIPFFKDDRYIKIEGRPVFIIFNPEDIDCFYEMKEVWKRETQAYDIPEPFYIGRDTESLLFDASLHHAVIKQITKAGSLVKEYSDISSELLEDSLVSSNKTILCGHTGFDDTPRRGGSGFVTDHLDPEVFYRQMKYLFYLSYQRGKEFVFVNAWNEWGEGMHLEPDEQFGYAYLEALKRAKQDYLYISTEEIQELKELEQSSYREIIKRISDDKKRYYSIMRILEEWLFLKERNGNIVEQIKRLGYSSIAIYGYGMLGKHLLKEIIVTGGISVDFIVDQKSKNLESIPCYAPDSILPPTDAIIVTPMWDFDNICESIKDHTSADIVSFSTLFY